MAELKLTKNELRKQQTLLIQLEKYLPTLQLKKAMLQAEVNEARQKISQLKGMIDVQRIVIERYTPILSQKISLSLDETIKVSKVFKRYENIAGVEVPVFEGVEFEEIPYSLFDIPPWVDIAIEQLREIASLAVEIEVVKEKKKAIEKDLREVSIRVNLFEKILIPRAAGNIKKIKVFLGDQQLAAVSQAKVAKSKIEANKERLLQRGFHAL